MKLKLALAAFAVLSIACAAATYYALGTPHYSLYLLQNAVRHKDAETFHRYFDTEQVIKNNIARKTSGMPATIGALADDVVRKVAPFAEPVVSQKIDEKLKSPEGLPLKDMSLESVRYEGSSAFVSLRDAGGGVLSIEMQRTADRRWKVVDIDLGAMGLGIDTPKIGGEPGARPSLPTPPHADHARPAPPRPGPPGRR